MATDNVARGLAAHALSVAVAGGGDQPVESVNGKTGKVNLGAADVGALSTNGGTMNGDLDMNGHEAINVFAVRVTSQPTEDAHLARKDYVDNAIKSVGGGKFIVNLTENVGNGTYTADKNWNEIKEAYDDNKMIVVHLGTSELPLMNAEFASNGGMGFTFGYTKIGAQGATITTRAIHYLHTGDSDTWEDDVAEGEYLSISGGTMVGSLKLARDPIEEEDASTKKYVDERLFEISFQQDQTAGLIANKTIEEVNAAKLSGKTIVGIFNNNRYPLTMAGENEFILSNTTGSISSEIIYSAGAWSIQTVTLMPTSGGDFTGNIDMTGHVIKNVQKIHIDGEAPLYLGSTVESSGTNGTRLTGTTSGEAAFVKADKQVEYVPVFVGDPTNNNHSANKKYVDDAVAGRLPIVSAQTGQLKAYLQNGSNPDVCLVSDNGSVSSITRYNGAGQIVVNPAPTANNHVANKKYVDDIAAKELPLTGGTISGNLMVGGDMSVSGTMSALKAPVSDVDVCNKAYVDSKINGVFSYDASTETLTITTV